MRLPLVGPRVELRPFVRSDLEAAHRVYSDERVMRWVGGGPVGSLKQSELMVRQYIDHQHRHGFSFWAVIERQSGELIGDAGLYTRDSQIERAVGGAGGQSWLRAGRRGDRPQRIAHSLPSKARSIRACLS